MKWLTEIATAKGWDFMGFESLKNQQELSVVRICMEKNDNERFAKMKQIEWRQKNNRKEWVRQAIKL